MNLYFKEYYNNRYANNQFETLAFRPQNSSFYKKEIN